ncbi:MAG: tetratricopeptide repeat protein, partial [Promethearchaeota archaeon]
MPIKKCPNCGYKLNRKFKICRNCGARISKKSENAPVLGELDENFKRLTDKGIKLLKQDEFEAAMDLFNQAVEYIPNPAAAWFFIGLAAFNFQKYKEALICIEKSLKTDSRFEMSYDLKGTILDILGHFDEALEWFDKSIKLNPRNIKPIYCKGVIYSRNKDFENAIKLFDRVLKIDKNFPLAWTSKGIALISQQKFEEALKCLTEALRIDPNLKEAMRYKSIALNRLGRKVEAISMMDDITRKDPEDFRGWVDKGLELGRLGHHSEALESFNKALEINSELHIVWSMKGTALMSLGKLDEALECYKKALELNNKDVNVWARIGETLIWSKKFHEALKILDEALEIFPNSAEILYFKGHTFGCQNNYSEAIKYFDKALEKDPSFKPAKKEKDIALKMLELSKKPIQSTAELLKMKPKEFYEFYNKGVALGRVGDYENAITMFDEALKLKPDLMQALHNKGSMLSELKRFDEAIKCFNKGIELAPEDPKLWSNKGAALMNLKRSDEAMKAIEKSLELDPAYEDGWVNKGAILDILNEHQRALECLDRAIKINPNSDKAWYNKSVVLKKLGKLEEANQAKDKAISINPALATKDVLFIADTKSFGGSMFSKKSISKDVDPQKGLVCYTCGDPIEIGDKYCKKCGAQLGKSPEKVPIMHLGFGVPSMEAVDVEELKKRGMFQFDDENAKPIDINNPPPGMPSFEEMQNLFETVDKGTAHAREGRLEQAIECYDEALKIVPYAWMTLMTKASVLMDFFKYEDVIDVTDKLLSYHPGVADGWYLRGKALINLGRFEEAHECFKNVIKIEPSHEPAKIELERFSEIKKDGVEMVNLIGEAKKYESKGDFNKAIELYDKILLKTPNNILAIAFKGLAFKELKEFNKALAIIEQGIDLIDTLPFIDNKAIFPLWLGKAATLSEMGKFEDSLQYFDKAMEILPDDFQALFFKGITLMKLNRNNEALPLFEKASEFALKNDVRAVFSKGTVLLSMNKLQEAIQAFDAVLNIEPENFEALCNKGVCYINLQEHKKALDCFNKALKLKPNDEGALNYKRMLLRLIDAPSKENMKKGLELYDKGVELHMRDQDQEALKFYDKSLKLYPRFAETWMEKGSVLTKLNRIQEAIECF